MRYAFAAVVAALATALLLFRPDAPQAAAAPPPAALPADLALVPADAAGFVHIRLADLWQNEMMSNFRKTWEKAGPKALATLDKQFVPSPTTLVRGTAFVMLGDNQKPQVVGVLAFSAAFDQKAVLKTYLPDAAAEQVGGKTVYRSANSPAEVYFPDNKHIVIGADGSLAHYLAKPPAADGPLTPALRLAASGTKVLVASADISALPIPPDALEQVPADVRPILKAKQLTVAIDIGTDPRLDVRAAYADADAAQDAEKAVKALADLGRKELAKAKKELEGKLYDPAIKTPRPADDLPEAIASVFALGALARLDDTLTDPKLITRDKAELALAVPFPKEVLALVGTSAVGVGLLLPAVQKVRGAAARMNSMNNLKQIGIAIHSYHDANDQMPHDIVDKNGKPLLSWRVAILPYIEQDALYKQFKLDEPWDSEANTRASQTMVKTFVLPEGAIGVAVGDRGWGLTNYRGISGPGAAFESGKKLRLTDFTDGTSNTIMVIETPQAVPWAKPGDFPFDPKQPLPKIVATGGNTTFNALFGDGSVRAIKTTTAEKTLKALFTRNGDEIIDDKDY